MKRRRRPAGAQEGCRAAHEGLGDGRPPSSAPGDSMEDSARPSTRIKIVAVGNVPCTTTQRAALFTSAAIFASSGAVNSFRAKTTGHIAPLSRFAASLKPNDAYLALNFSALWK
jgi:hypothetical protein